jgi:hypothetical protein
VVGELAAKYATETLGWDKEKALNFAKVMSAASGLIVAQDGNDAGAVNLANTMGTNAAANNYLKHAETNRKEALLKLKAQKKCDNGCVSELEKLEALDKARNAELEACKGSTTPQCQAAEKAVREAAAEYVRLKPNSSSILYDLERQETLEYAQGTMSDFTNWNKTVGFIGSSAEGVKNFAGLILTGVKAAAGNKDAQGQIAQIPSAAWGYVSEPSNWPSLFGAMTPAEREQLAQAYERGDGQAVAIMMGEQATELPMLGGTIKKVGVVGKLDDVGTNLISPQRLEHILFGDKTGGGHLWPGSAGKSPFPENWSEEKIVNVIFDIAKNPSIEATVQSNGRIVKNATIDGVNVRVVLESPAKGGGVVTAFPTNTKRNLK